MTPKEQSVEVPAEARKAAEAAFLRLPDGAEFRERLKHLPEYGESTVIPPAEVAEQMLAAAIPAIHADVRERWAERCEEVYAGLADLRQRREREGKDSSAAYLQGRQHEASNQAAALRDISTADLRANVWGEALAAVVTAARSWLVREHGDTRPSHPADDAAARLFDALAALPSTKQEGAQDGD